MKLFSFLSKSSFKRVDKVLDRKLKMPFTSPKFLDKTSSKELLDKVDNFLFDCDGVIWDFPRPIPGSVECINKLKAHGLSIKFIISCSYYF